MTVRVRLAPSPTGTLHIGTARTALFNYLFAKSQKGKFLLRVEDTDKERSKIEYLENILEGLNWLGIQWDEKPVIQSQRIDNHKKTIKILLEKGLAYRCYLNDKELEGMREAQRLSGKPPRYDNRSRELSKSQEEKFIEQGRSSVIRFRIENEESITWDDLIRGPMKWMGQDLGGDMVIARRSSPLEIGEPLYNLVVVTDDSAMGITHVIRGEDHLSNTAKQILLYKALGLKIPEFAHTPLILNSEGKKLSKRDGVTSINDFKEKGYTPEALTNYMALLGWSPPEGKEERFNLREATSLFNLERVNKSGAKFDWDKLNWLNSQVINEYSIEELLESIEKIWLKEGWKIPSKEWGEELCQLIAPSLITIKDAIEQSSAFFEDPELEEDGKKQLGIDGAKDSLIFLLQELNKDPWDGKDFTKAKEIIQKTAEKTKIKKGLIMKSLRAALLGKLQGPDLIQTWGLLAKVGEDQKRIKKWL